MAFEVGRLVDGAASHHWIQDCISILWMICVQLGLLGTKNLSRQIYRDRCVCWSVFECQYSNVFTKGQTTCLLRGGRELTDFSKKYHVSRFSQWKNSCEHNWCRKQIFLPHTVSRKKFVWLTQVTLFVSDWWKIFNIEVRTYKVSTKRELNLQKLKHFHMFLRMLEIPFPRTELLKFSGKAYPGSPLDTSTFARRFFFLNPVSLNPKTAPGSWVPFLSQVPWKKKW